MVVGSAFVDQAEHGVNGLMASPFDAFWWGPTTLTAVGNRDSYPVTLDGRLRAMVLIDPPALTNGSPYCRPRMTRFAPLVGLYGQRHSHQDGATWQRREVTR